MRYVVAFGKFWWDFVIGDDWRIAAGVAAVLGVGAVLVAATGLPDAAVVVVTALGIMGVVSASIVAGALGSVRSR